MLGIVWTYSEITGEGLIIACDKQLYRFSKTDYSPPVPPRECTMVDFRIDGDLAKEMLVITSKRNH